MTATTMAYDKFLRDVDSRRRKMRSSLLMFGIIAFLAVAVAWAWVTEIDEVTRGDGRVIPSQHVQEIQSLEGGIVQSILVREGQTVEAGEVLMVLDQTSSVSEMNQLRQRQLALMAEIARLSAEIAASDLVLAPEILNEAPDVAVTQQSLFAARRSELASELEILRQQLLQRDAELLEARSELQTASRGLALTESEIGMVEPLVRRGVEPEITLLQLQRSHADFAGRRDAAELRIERLALARREVEEKRQAAIERHRSEGLQQLSRATAELAEVKESMPVRVDRVSRAEVRSPVRGVVNRLHIKTIGGVARPGEPLSEVVPIDDVLQVEAYVQPADIAFVHPNQRVKVKITAYDFARYGALDGRIITIGADAINRPDSEETVYPVRIEVESRLYDADGHPLEIVPGMVAEIDVLMGKRTVLKYFTQPVIKAKQTAFREL
ncbi:MAG: HlyD family type I secretion periplasmic adaptor subunit [Rhodospirillales bacterium]|nr:MAG: HlyD family type I secretion periplasmic adaptor subunit [Rhodospirillales bacterium]